MSEEKKKDVTEEAKETKTEETKAETVQEEIIEEAPEKTPETEKEKKEAKKDKKDPKDAQIEDLTDRLRRTMAEFDNFRKRTEKEKSAMFEIGAKTVIEKLLPVIDNFERGLAAVTEDEKETPFAQGVELVYKQLITSFDELGVKPIEAVGKEFDPNLHNAVMMVDDDSLESGTVAEEMQKGYMYKESVVRHSMVKVVN